MTRALLLLLLASQLAACTSLGYYGQSVRGHLGLLAAREPVSELLEQPDLDPKLRRKLELSSAIRAYASEALALPDNASYRSFVKIDRPHLLWSVFAAPELSLEPKLWCFIFVGCVPYRGYFAKPAAQAYAAELEKEGYDVHVAGVAAYSTLGWFADPLLGTMFRYDDAQLAHFIFHELAHQQTYIKDDTAFNEAFAEAVAETGVARWFQSRGEPEAIAAYRQKLDYRNAFVGWLAKVRERLDAVYRQSLPNTDKRARKMEIFADMRREYESLKAGWGGYTEYDDWFDKPINNARLIAVAVYRDQVDTFKRLFTACGSHYPRFYRQVELLGKMKPVQRATALESARCEHE